MEKTSAKTRLVLIGDSISHIYILSKLVRETVSNDRSPKLEVLLISPVKKYFHPEMLGGFLEGIYHEEEFLFDLEKICDTSGASFIQGEIDQIAVKERLIQLHDGKNIPFDILSIGLHNHLEGEEIEGVKKFALPVNTYENILNLKKYFLERPIDCNITVVGSSERTVELVFTLCVLAQKWGMKARITIIDASHSILQGYDFHVKNLVLNELKDKCVELILGRRITLVTEDFLIFDDRTILKHDYLIWNTTPVAGPLLKRSGFTVDDKGFMVVNNHLRSIDASNIFGSGGTIRTPDGNYFKVRDFGIYEAIILLDNIKSRIDNAPLKRRFDPSRKRPHNLSLGAGVGVFYYHPIVLKGKLGWIVNHHLHKNYLKQKLK